MSVIFKDNNHKEDATPTKQHFDDSSYIKVKSEIIEESAKSGDEEIAFIPPSRNKQAVEVLLEKMD